MHPQPAHLSELPVYKRLGLTIQEGDGVWVFDAEGRSYLDLYGGHAAAVLGYRHPTLLSALNTQAERLFFQTNLVDVEVRNQAVTALSALAPERLSRVFFVNSGAEANENALRMALRATGRGKVLALEGGFHGRTAAAAAVTWGSGSWYGFVRPPMDVDFLPFGDEEALAAALDDEVAALILEPVQGVAGARALDPSYLQAARALCDASGALLIADEVQCGMGRTGVPFAVQAAGVTPDILSAGKGLAGGFPCGAVLCTEDVAAHVGPGDLGTTFGGGPLACALVAAVCVTLLDDGLIDRAARLGERIRSECRRGPVKSIGGRGLLVGLQLDRPAAEALAALRARGILAGGSAQPDTIRLMPPLILEDEHVDLLVDALELL